MKRWIEKLTFKGVKGNNSFTFILIHFSESYVQFL